MDLSVVIINHKQDEFLKRLLSSFSYLLKKVEVLVINNIYSQEISLFLKKKYPSVRLINNKKPQGYAKNCNFGIKNTKGRFILILNSDTIILKKAIEKMYFFMKKNHQIGVCGPKLIYPDGNLQLSARRFPTIKTFFIRRTPLRSLLKKSKINLYHLGVDIDHSKTQPVDWLLGAVLMIRRKAIEEIGFFDEKYYLYVEDIDLCYRAWKKGWEVWYVPESVMIHHYFALSDKKFFSLYNLYHFKSMWYYFWKNIVFKKLK